MTSRMYSENSSDALRRRVTRSLRVAILTSVCGLTLGACGFGRIGLNDVRPADAYRQTTESALAGPSLGIDTRTTLRRTGFLDLCDENTERCIDELRSHALGHDFISDELFALAELSLRFADDLVREASTRAPTTAATKASGPAGARAQPDRIPVGQGARAHYLASALYAYAFLFPADGGHRVQPLDPRMRLAADIYARALARAFYNDTHGGMFPAAGTYRLPFGEIEVSFDEEELRWGRRILDDFHWVGASEIHGVNNRYRDAGIGTPVAAKTALVDDTFDFVNRSAWVPATVLLRIPSPRKQVRGALLEASLEIHTANESPTVEIEGRDYPLEFDPTAALAASIEHSRVWENELTRFLGRAIGVKRGSALGAMEPYVTGRIPVVFVHGTDSSVATWVNMVNDLQRDPRVREKFHFWYFAYDSGNSILYSTMLLRRALNEAVDRMRQAGGGPCLDHMVVLGHSQGGLLTKLTSVETGSAFWDTYFNKPIEEVPLRPEMEATYKEMAFLAPLPYVRRVVFLATPHRGSFLAGPQIVRRLAARLIQLPREIIELGADQIRLSRYLRPENRLGRVPTSIDNMSPNDPFIRTSSELTIVPEVKAHSIVALMPGDTKDGGSDGVVKYSSAHIEGVESEVIVPDWHSVLGNPIAIEEVRRILLLHASNNPCAGIRQREIAYPGDSDPPLIEEPPAEVPN